MNKFIGIGRLTKDIELRYTQSGQATLNNSIAIKNDFKNANGEYDSEFINIVLWKNNAEFLSKYGSKGSMVAVEGRLTTRSYTNNEGVTKYITEVVCNNIQLLDSKKKEETNTQYTSGYELQKNNKANDPFEEMANQVEINDNDLPF